MMSQMNDVTNDVTKINVRQMNYFIQMKNVLRMGDVPHKLCSKGCGIKSRPRSFHNTIGICT
jgi:hypothetical protein